MRYVSGGAGSTGWSNLSKSQPIERKFVRANVFGRISGAATVTFNLKGTGSISTSRLSVAGSVGVLMGRSRK